MTDLSSPLITLADNVFEYSFIGQSAEAGIYSPRDGQLVSRGTGYAVTMADPMLLDTTKMSGGAVFVEIVEFIADNFTSEWATEEPEYLFAGFDQGILAFTKVIILNDMAEAARKSVAQGFYSFLGLADSGIYIIEQPSPEAVAYRNEFLSQLAEWVQDDTNRRSDPVGPTLHTQPNLSDNPWNTPYNRTHL
jgi:hypothetical protein